MKRIAAGCLALLLSGPALADQVIMKDGKVYKGKIMGETARSVLISDPTPRFLPMADIMTIVRERNPEDPPPDLTRYVSVGGGLSTSYYLSKMMGSSASAGLHAEGGFRMHPLVEVGADLDWTPGVSGDLAIFDGQTLRGYRRFWSFDGGFFVKGFPAASRGWSYDPYVLAGYQWSRLTPKASGDALKGSAWRWGAGVQRPFAYGWVWDVRLLYARVRYDAVDFVGNAADLRDSVHHDALRLHLLIAHHF